MALSNSTVQELRDLTFALIGREYDTTTASYGRINTLWNYAATKAYRASNYWERYLVIGEERAVTKSNTVEQQEGSVTYSDAGTSSVNGKYYKGEMSTHGNFHNYYQYDGDGNKVAVLKPTSTGSSPVWDLCSIDGETETCLYTNTSSSTVPLTFNSEIGGSLPLPTGELTDTIDTFLRIYSTDPNIVRGNEVRFVVNKNGATLTMEGGVPQSGLYLNTENDYYLQPSSDNTIKQVYVTYKKKLDIDLQSDGAATQEVPSEFVEYMAHLAAYTWQRSVEQNASQQNYTLSLSLVNSILEDQLAKISDQDIANSYIVKNVRTNYNQLII